MVEAARWWERGDSVALESLKVMKTRCQLTRSPGMRRRRMLGNVLNPEH